MVEAVVTRLGEELDLPAAAIMIAASHTHSAPHTIEGDAAPGTFDGGFAQQAAAGMIASALQAAEKLEPVTLRYERGQSDLGVKQTPEHALGACSCVPIRRATTIPRWAC